mmetsp:Transcript_17784/g.22434  ORF Transcript_17784/g.22434 Transcript_17784/m.22434 type:complete len:135 (-) Transcript_17784:378-782(-)
MDCILHDIYHGCCWIFYAADKIYYHHVKFKHLLFTTTKRILLFILLEGSPTASQKLFTKRDCQQSQHCPQVALHVFEDQEQRLGVSFLATHSQFLTTDVPSLLVNLILRLVSSQVEQELHVTGQASETPAMAHR